MNNLDGEWEQFLNDENFEDFEDINTDVELLNKNNNDDIKITNFIPKCNDIYISTKSQIIFLSDEINIFDIFWKLNIINYYEQKEGIIMKQIKVSCINDEEIKKTEENINKVENTRIVTLSNSKLNNQKKKYKKTIKITIGYCSKDITSIRTKDKKAFYNCLVLILRLKIENYFKEMHVKIFNTGKIEIPGIQNDWILNKILEKIIEYLKPFNNNIFWKPETLQTILINSNFSCNFHINREKLKNIIKYKNGLSVSYDPCSYPGIQCKFYNNINNKKNDGICYCIKKNNDNNDNKEENLDLVKRKTKCSCISVSFMIFRTGNVLIVGHCTTEILIKVYDYIKNILETHYEEIKDDTKIVSKKKNNNKKIRKKTIHISPIIS